MTNEIILRRARETDFEAFWSFCSNNEVAKYLTWPVYTDKNICKVFFQKFLDNYKLPNCYLMIEYQGKTIGNVHMISRSQNSIQIGLGILPEYWGKKIGEQVLKQIETFIITESNGTYCEIIADSHRDNIAIQKILLKESFVFFKDIENSRKSYRKITAVGGNNFNFISWLESLDSVECVILGGSLNENELSDIDAIVIMREEKDINDFVRKINAINCITYYEFPSPNHLFVSFNNEKIFDIYIVSTAFVNMFCSGEKNTIIDKTGLVPSVMHIQGKFSVEKCFLAYIQNIKKLIYKLQNKKFIQATRILSDIRNEFIIPLGKECGVLSAENTINVVWHDYDSLFWSVYKATFSPPCEKELVQTVSALIDLVALILKKFQLNTYEYLLEELKKYEEFFS